MTLSKIYGFMRLVTILLWSIAAFVDMAKAQPLSLAFHHLGRDQGLSQGTCPFVSRDSRGFVWIASTDGLNRYDGQHVKVYRPNLSKPHSMVGNIVTSACYEDSITGDLWFTTYNAVHRYIRGQDHFDTFQLKNQAHQRLVEDYYAFHLESSGRLWLRVGTGNESYLHWFDTKSGRDSIVCRLSGARSVVIPGNDGNIKQVLCSSIDNKGLEITDIEQNFLKKIYFRESQDAKDVNEVFVENDTLVWLGLYTGIAAFNPKTGISKTYSAFQNQSAGDVWSVFPYRDRFLFVATAQSGLWLFNRKSRQFLQRFGHEPENVFSLMDNEVKNLYIDRQDNLWASHWKYGLSHVNLRKNKFFVPEGANGGSIWRILNGPDNNIWCCEPGKGLLVYTPDGRLLKTIDTYFPKIKKRLRFTTHFYFPKGSPWGYSGKYLFKWAEKKQQLEIAEELPFRITNICAMEERATYVLAEKGIFRLLDEGNGQYHFEPVPLLEPMPTEHLTNIFADRRGFVYVAENFERLLIFKEVPTGLSFVKSINGVGKCTDFLEKPDEQGLWVSCNAGLLHIDANLTSRVLTEDSDGVPNATYYNMASDARGQLWLSSNQGLLCYNPTLRSTRRFLTLDGLFGAEFNEGSFFKNRDGRIWAGGVGGLVIFHPDSVHGVPFEPRVQFTQILVNDQPREDGQPAEATDKLDLPYSQNTLSFEFVALEFSDPSANKFQYRLVGYDDKWVNSGTRGFARYANLPPGEYTFEVLAANSDALWSKMPKTLKINIQAPFYKTWWFYMLCVLSLGGLVYAWLWYRLQQALKIERMRVQISSDLHDDVGTLLAGLAMQSEALELTAAEKDKGKLRRISDISRNAMSHMRDTVWAIDARKDKVENLLDRMREHAEETLTPRDFYFDIQVDNLSLKQNLSTHIRQNLYLVFKEAVTNAAKHSNGDRVLVTLKKTDTGFEMRIWDNGNTTEKAYKTTGLGTSNMAMRAEKIGASLEIIRTEGFCVLLRMGRLG